MMARYRRRTPWVLAAFFCAWLLLGWRLWLWQVAGAAELIPAAVSQHMVRLPLRPRGAIVDRNGIPLSDPQPRWGVALFPPLWQAGGDPPEARAVARLAAALGMPVSEVDARIQSAGREPFWLARELSAEQARAVAALALRGVAVVPRVQRYGPGALARHLVGNGWAADLERQYDAELTGWQFPVGGESNGGHGSGESGALLTAGPHLAVYLDGGGRALGGLGIRQVEILPGRPEEMPWNLRLTLDARMQRVVEQVLDATGAGGAAGAGDAAATPPLRAGVVVLDVESGDLLAVASRPNFDPLLGPQPGADWGQLLNRAFSGYPPGSVFKPLVAAIALEEGLAGPETEFDCPGHYEMNGHTFREPVPGGHGRVTLAEAIGKSCNIAFIQLGYEVLGRELLLQAAARFGLGRPVGTALPGEQPGMVPAPAHPGDVAMFAFGQGAFLVTPVQLARAYAALATDGTLPPVGLVQRLEAPDGEWMFQPPRLPRERAVSPETARTLARLLQGVTEPGGQGTGRLAWVPGWGSAGKTGSAEDGVAGEEVHAWFVGWVPVDRPRYAIAVLVENGGAGGKAAAPIFQAIARGILALQD